jgi:predicted branched-subunit amino acid permease
MTHELGGGSIRGVAAGLLDALPFAPSVLTLGAIFGASTGPAGISPPAAMLMSALVFSGAGQFAALPLWPQGGPVVILSTLALSLRFALITTSLAPMLAGRSGWVRAALAYCVTDENYALAVTRTAGRLEPAYLVGAWIVLYGTWVLGTLVGVLLGAQVPSTWVGPLKAVFPLVFLVLTVLLCTSVRLALVAGFGAVLSVLGMLVLPNGWNIILAGLLASLVGPLLERIQGGQQPA